MTKEDEKLLLTDLCGRILYGVTVQLYRLTTINNKVDKTLTPSLFAKLDLYTDIVTPYLRQMSSMTNDERNHWKLISTACTDWDFTARALDWLNCHHFDYRGLIEKGLALEAPKEMYKY